MLAKVWRQFDALRFGETLDFAAFLPWDATGPELPLLDAVGILANRLSQSAVTAKCLNDLSIGDKHVLTIGYRLYLCKGQCGASLGWWQQIAGNNGPRGGQLAPMPGPAPTTRGYYASFKVRLIATRKSLHWTQEDMATALGIPLVTYKSYERRSKFPLHLLEQLARVTHRDVEYIVTGKAKLRQVA